MEMMLLEDCCEILDSMRIPITASDRTEGPYPYYGANGVQDHVADYIFDDELVLLAEDGGNFGSKERPIAYRVSGKCWVNNHAHVLKPKDGIDVDYLCYSLMFYNTDGLVNGATRQKLTQTTMRKMLIPKRSLPEQKEIVKQLNAIVTIKDMRQQDLQKLDELIKARFVEMFGDPVENPQKWDTKSLVTMGFCKNGMNFHTGDNGVSIHCLGVGDFKNYSVVDGTEHLPTVSLNEEPSAESMLQDGDIVFVRSNGNKALVGRCVVVYPHGTPTTYSGFCIRYRLTSHEVTTMYLLQVLKMDSMRKRMVGRGANIQNLNQQILASLDIPLPPLRLQQQYSDFVSQIDKSKAVVQRQINDLQELFDKKMDEYFGGDYCCV